MKPIKLFDISLDDAEKNLLDKILKSKFWASGGSTGFVKNFEDIFKEFTRSKKCITVNSGTAALYLALSLFNIKNSEVILPSLSFVSTAHAVIANGGIPKFVDVQPDTLCIDPSKVKKAITKKTKLILPVHFGGTPCNLNELLKICKSHSLFLVEDAAHASGSFYNSKPIGSHGDAVCFSFHPTKNLPMPSGGAITLNHKNWKYEEKILLSKRWCGITNRNGKTYDVNSFGWNYYMNEFSAGIGLVQLKKLPKLISRRKHIAKKLSKGISLENKMPYSKDVANHFYWIRVKNRKEFIKKMSEVGIETGIHYRPIHTFNFYSKYNSPPLTTLIGNEIVSLPCHSNLSDNDVEKIIKFTNKFSKY